MAEKKVTLNPGDTLTVVSPIDPEEWDEVEDFYQNAYGGAELRTVKGRRVHVCFSDEIICLIEMFQEMQKKVEARYVK